jgi:hypothetical protein
MMVTLPRRQAYSSLDISEAVAAQMMREKIPQTIMDSFLIPNLIISEIFSGKCGAFPTLNNIVSISVARRGIKQFSSGAPKHDGDRAHKSRRAHFIFRSARDEQVASAASA